VWPLPARTAAARSVTIGVPLFVAGLLLAWVASTHESWLRSKDMATNQWFFDTGGTNRVLHAIATGVSWLGAGERVLPILILVVVTLFACRQWRWAIFVLVSSQVGFLISNAIKLSVGRTRPPFTEVAANQVGMSFPSGHTFAGIATWGAFAIVALYLLSRPWSTGLAIALLACGIANGPSRLLLGKHWVSDVIAAWLLGTGWLLLVWAGFLITLAPRPAPAPPPTPEPGALDLTA